MGYSRTPPKIHKNWYGIQGICTVQQVWYRIAEWYTKQCL